MAALKSNSPEPGEPPGNLENVLCSCGLLWGCFANTLAPSRPTVAETLWQRIPTSENCFVPLLERRQNTVKNSMLTNRRIPSRLPNYDRGLPKRLTLPAP